MRAIVTGGCGFIGYSLCLELDRLGWQFTVIDDLSTGHSSNKIKGHQYYQVSLNDPIADNVMCSYQPDVIFHLAAVPRVSYSVEHPYETTMSNVMGTLAVLDAMKTIKLVHGKSTRLVYSGSSSIYGGADTLPTDEDHPPGPKSPYALQKYQGEEWCRMFSSLYDLDTVILRYFNVIGPYSRYGGAYSTVLSAWLYSIYVDPSIKPYLEGDGTQSRDFCFIDNAVQANILAAQSSEKFRGIAFNIAQGQSNTLLQVKDMLEEISGTRLDLEYRPKRIGDVDHTLADIELAKLVLGYNPSTNFVDQLRSMASWYKDVYSVEVDLAKESK